MPKDQSRVTVTIDGRKLEVERGTTILKAAGLVGIHIPTLCYHPKVSILGACRLCLVEVEGLNKLIASCQTPVSEGMIVRTTTSRIKKVRQTMLELLLARHPLDCLTCDKGGWCELQNLTFAYGPASNRFPLEQDQYAVEDASPFVERDTKKCVMCRRCIRVCKELRGVNVWGAMYRGFDKKICTFFEKPLDYDFQDPFNCEFCGSCIDICPVGALTAKPSKFLSRPWEVSTSEMSCPFCGVGCRATAHYRPGRLVKTTPVKDAEGSLSDLCFRGRFGTIYVNHPSRIASCLIRKEGGLVPVETDEAINFLLKRISREATGAAAFISTSSSEFEAFGLASFISAAAPGNRVAALDSRGEVEEGPMVPYDEENLVRVDDLARAKKLMVIGQDLTFTHPVAGIRLRQACARGAKMLLMDPLDTLLGLHASWWLRPPVAYYPSVIGALAEIVQARGKTKAVSAILKNIAGLSPEEWPEILDWIEGPGEITLVVQNMPGGRNRLMRGAIYRLASVMGDTGLRQCYIPLDANGYGVPLMIRAAGFHSQEEQVAGLLGGDETLPMTLFLRADPIGESWRVESWKSLRKRSNCWVTFDSFLTETASLSDVVFPLPHYLENEGTVLSAGGPGEFRRLYPPPPSVRPLSALLEALAGKLGVPRAGGPGSLRVEDLRNKGAELIGGGEAGQGSTVLEEERLPKPKKGERILSIRFHRLPGQRLRAIEARKILGPTQALEMNPDDARALGFHEADKATVLFEGHNFTFLVTITPRVPAGQLYLPFDPEFRQVAEFINFVGVRHVPAWGGITVKLEKG